MPSGKNGAPLEYHIMTCKGPEMLENEKFSKRIPPKTSVFASTLGTSICIFLIGLYLVQGGFYVADSH